MEPVTLTWTPCNYGGYRPWFRCPGAFNDVLCDRRVARLYARSHYFLCRHCYQLAYSSQNVSVGDRPLNRAQDIRRQLGGSSNLLVPFPMKPKKAVAGQGNKSRSRGPDNHAAVAGSPQGYTGTDEEERFLHFGSSTTDANKLFVAGDLFCLVSSSEGCPQNGPPVRDSLLP